ncbi:hypothetical protein BC834DRAFT_843222 [Gloeopeniophorella convolvens]|nr:hypothetical protein BC834DRAFT_843222 [Gloeopeniophorella convolvens]
MARGNDTELPSVQAPDGFCDPSSKMWTLYLCQAEKHDKEFAESLKGNMEGILVFVSMRGCLVWRKTDGHNQTGLFSAALATFLVESYQKLSPAAGDISRQNVENFAPSLSAVRVNVLWFSSLVLNLTCALTATLMQQWSRRYQQLTRRRSTPHARARVRAFLYRGTERSQLVCVVEGMMIALHASVGLFLFGLFDFLRPINQTVAFAVLGLEAAFALAYCGVTLAPSISLDLPYITPLSSGVWRLSQAATISYLKLSDVIWPGPSETIKLHETRLKGGLQESVLSSATQAPPDIDKEALGWLLEKLDEDHEVNAFISSIPGFFDSKIVEDPDSHPEINLFGNDVGLKERDRERGLRSCLRALWYCVRAYCNHTRTASEVEDFELPNYVWATFTEPSLLDALKSHSDPFVKLSSRCILTLLQLRHIHDARHPNTVDMPATILGDGIPKPISQSLDDSKSGQQSSPDPGVLDIVVAFISDAVRISQFTTPLSPWTLKVLHETLDTLHQQIVHAYGVHVPLTVTQATHSLFADCDAELLRLFRDVQQKHVFMDQLEQLSRNAQKMAAEPAEEQGTEPASATVDGYDRAGSQQGEGSRGSSRVPRASSACSVQGVKQGVMARAQSMRQVSPL